jgi:elongator complex protein 3
MTDADRVRTDVELTQPAIDNDWQPRGRDFDAGRYHDALLAIFEAARTSSAWDQDHFLRILAQHPRDSKGYFSKIELVQGYRQLTDAGVLPFERQVLRRLQMKPVRTASGVAPVTVLTEPAGCPAHCIFCPDDVRMPKSYLPNEPGARRAAQCNFDPYAQVRTRLDTFETMGHTADKVELLILGGTWSAYSRRYREWFVRRCLDAMNWDPDLGPGQEAATLAEAQAGNEGAAHRNVGLVIETRPDWIRPSEVVHLRRLGVTKVQLGVQSLDDRILELNGRGHDVAAARRAVKLLRGAGFKLHLHWMPNLLGATPESDRADFAHLWTDPGLRPDEIKIYPCSIIAGTELFNRWQAGEFRPYTDEELIDLVADCKTLIPPYCRVNRVFRDIPADDIVAGSKRSNLRQLVHETMAARGQVCHCIRCREIRATNVEEADLRLVVHEYETDGSRERFLSYETTAGQLAGFCRLSLPDSSVEVAVPEIQGAAMIRELHVYGPALGIGSSNAGEAQHLGLGRRLVALARAQARSAGFSHLAVISAIGTRRYYEALGFHRGELYMVAELLSQE